MQQLWACTLFPLDRKGPSCGLWFCPCLSTGWPELTLLGETALLPMVASRAEVQTLAGHSWPVCPWRLALPEASRALCQSTGNSH